MAAQDLLIFALGPVQSFIATARRTQDLWMGSQLLSHLALVGVESATSIPDVEMFFPVQIDGRWPRNIPNRFVAAVPSGQGENLGPQITVAVEQAWKDTAHQVYTYFAGFTREPEWGTVWERQVKTWLETFWVAWPWDGKNYGTAYRRAGLALDARKRIRPYPVKPEPGEKCTLCGVRQALHGKRDRGRQAIRDFWRDVAARPNVTGAELREGERLCAICTIKRFAGKARATVNRHPLDTDRFPSTSSIAAAVFKANLLEHWVDLEKPITAHLRALDKLNQSGDEYPIRLPKPDPFPHLKGKPGANQLLSYDGAFFYRETFTPERLEEILGRGPDETARQAALNTLNRLLEVATDLPHNYLTVLALDGDRMGKLLSECTHPDQHKAISGALTIFAEERARNIVEVKHPGRLIYSGGDDVLALLPVECVLSVADELRQALTEELERAGYPDRSASAGVAIVHHMQPLEGALRAAKNAEHSAKEQHNRSALAVDVLRRSGERRQVGMNWSYNQKKDTFQALGPIVAVQADMRSNSLSSKLAYDVSQEAPILAGVDIPQEARKAELGRLFKRHAADGQESTVEALADQVADLAEQTGWSEIADWLLLARFLAKGGEK